MMPTDTRLSDVEFKARADAFEAMRAPEDWVREKFPSVVRSPFASRHIRVLRWFAALGGTHYIRPQIEAWSRGGGKSTSLEMGIVLAVKMGTRKFILIVSGTQRQANKRLAAIQKHLEKLGIRRALNAHGAARSWNAEQLETEGGVTIAAYGLDTAIRGLKSSEYRPDLLCLDDLDRRGDTPAITERKIEELTNSVLPSGSEDCAIIFTQNVMFEGSIMDQVVNKTADFMYNAVIPEPEPALIGFQTVLTWNEEYGRNIPLITSGEPTWVGQSKPSCQHHINVEGLRSFNLECQHKVKSASGYFFDTSKIEIVDALPLDRNGKPVKGRFCFAMDLAATHGGGDHTVFGEGVRIGGQLYVTDIHRGQWASNKVREYLRQRAAEIHITYRPNYIIRIPQDPGGAGKDQKDQLDVQLAPYNHRFVYQSGAKADRALGLAEATNESNVKFVRGKWNAVALHEMGRFSAKAPKGREDGIVDTLAEMWNELAIGQAKMSTRLALNDHFPDLARARQTTWFEPHKPVEEDDDAGEFSKFHRVKRAS